VATEPVLVHADRAVGAPVVFALRRGEWAAVETGAVIATRPLRLAIPRATSIEYFASDGSARNLVATPGDDLYVLSPRGEGHFVAWLNGRVLDDVVPQNLQADVQEGERTVETEWWVNVRNADGLEGWTSATKSFANKGSCGDWTLTQPDLEARLNVSREEMERIPSDDVIPAWTEERDPEGVAWAYAPTGVFVALGSAATKSH
jgi:hypothetical protein